MLYITQLIYIKPGQEKSFHEFESVAISRLTKYNGQLVFRLSPTEESFIESTIEKPYEIHFIKFDSEGDLNEYMLDKERQKWIHLKEKSIERVVLVKGFKI